MLVLFETSAGFGLFKVLNENKLKTVDDIVDTFSSAENALKVLKLKDFKQFQDIEDAMEASSAIIEGKLPKSLKKFLQKKCKEESEVLAIADKDLARSIHKKLGLECTHNKMVTDIMNGIRYQLQALMGDMYDADKLTKMSLGLSYSLSRYKLKFSPDKIDTLIVQAISLLDELKKELNIYAMRLKEWYGWHFPELAKIIPHNETYAKVVLTMGNRIDSENVDLSDILSEEHAKEVKDMARISMGTAVSDEDMHHIKSLATEVIETYKYQQQLDSYVKVRMQAIAPNLTLLLGEILGAQLMAKAGSLMNLAKCPASTVQILGAEKALFRAMKSDQKTPKYGIIYNASLIGRTPAKFKGRIARVLAAKCAISCRVDALGEMESATIGHEGKDSVENRIMTLDGVSAAKFKERSKQTKEGKNRDSENPAKLAQPELSKYDEDGDVQMADEAKAAVPSEEAEKKKKKKKKRKRDEDDDGEKKKKKKKKKKRVA